MVELYLVRHVETEGNLQSVFQGHRDYPISENGKQQLKLLAKRFSKIHIDRAYSSPLSRAKLTALAILENKNIEIEEEPMLIELFGGNLEGRKFSDIFAEDKELSEAWHNHISDFRATKGESMQELYDRAWSGLLGIFTNPENNEKTVLAVSHGGTIRCIICRLLFGSVKHLGKTDGATNSAVTHIIYENGKITLDFVNDISHLPVNSFHGIF